MVSETTMSYPQGRGGRKVNDLPQPDTFVPIPDGMQIADLDLDPGEILKQLFATRRNFQKAELQVQELKTRLLHLQEALCAMQDVVAEGLMQA